MRGTTSSRLWAFKSQQRQVGKRLPMTKRKRQILASIGIIAVLSVAWLLTPYERRNYTCLHCRLSRTVETYWGVARVSDRPNECSQWYTAAHPDHEHDWKKSSCTYRRRGLTRSYSCRIDIHPVWDVVPEAQKMYLSTCTPEQMEAWFALLESEDTEDQEKALALVHQTFR